MKDLYLVRNASIAKPCMRKPSSDVSFNSLAFFSSGIFAFDPCLIYIHRVPVFRASGLLHLWLLLLPEKEIGTKEKVRPRDHRPRKGDRHQSKSQAQGQQAQKGK